MFKPWLYFLPKIKNLCTGINTFLFGGVFGVFYAKIVVLVARVLVLSIKFSFHSISGSTRAYTLDVEFVATIFRGWCSRIDG